MDSIFDTSEPPASANPVSANSDERHERNSRPANILAVRRRNLLHLLSEHAQREVAGGHHGTLTSFAAAIGVHKSLLSKLKVSNDAAEPSAGKSPRPMDARDVSDALARQIEQRLQLPAGWMDVEREETARQITAAEKSFLDLALARYRSLNAKDKRVWRKELEADALTRAMAEQG